MSEEALKQKIGDGSTVRVAAGEIAHALNMLLLRAAAKSQKSAASGEAAGQDSQAGQQAVSNDPPSETTVSG